MCEAVTCVQRLLNVELTFKTGGRADMLISPSVHDEFYARIYKTKCIKKINMKLIQMCCKMSLSKTNHARINYLIFLFNFSFLNLLPRGIAAVQ